MKFINAIFDNGRGTSITFGKGDPNINSKWQLLSITGIDKQTTKVFSNETINSQIRIYKGNRLPERQIIIKVSYMPKEEASNSNTQTNWSIKELELLNLTNQVSTTDIQEDENLGVLYLTSRNGNQYVIKNAIVENVSPDDTSKAYNNYIQLFLTIRAYDPYIYIGKVDGIDSVTSEVFDLSSSSIFTDFVDDSTFGTKNTVLEHKLEGGLEVIRDGEVVSSVRDGYISTDGIFYSKVTKDGNINDITTGGNGQFWLTDSLEKSLTNFGVRTYPIIRIYGYVVNPKIINNTTGQTFALNRVIESGQYVEIDTGKQTCFLVYIDENGIEVREDIRDFASKDTSWLYLETGNNDINVSYDTAISEEFHVDFSWEIRLEGIGI